MKIPSFHWLLSLQCCTQIACFVYILSIYSQARMCNRHACLGAPFSSFRHNTNLHFDRHAARHAYDDMMHVHASMTLYRCLNPLCSVLAGGSCCSVCGTFMSSAIANLHQSSESRFVEWSSTSNHSPYTVPTAISSDHSSHYTLSIFCQPVMLDRTASWAVQL